MIDLTAKPVNESNVSLYIENNIIMLVGNMDQKKSDIFMKPFLNEIHNKILKNDIKHVLVDIRRLRFMNSAGIRNIVYWIIKIDSLPDDQKYKITFLYDPQITWQEESLDALSSLSPNLTTTEAGASY